MRRSIVISIAELLADEKFGHRRSSPENIFSFFVWIYGAPHASRTRVTYRRWALVNDADDIINAPAMTRRAYWRLTLHVYNAIKSQNPSLECVTARSAVVKPPAHRNRRRAAIDCRRGKAQALGTVRLIAQPAIDVHFSHSARLINVAARGP